MIRESVLMMMMMMMLVMMMMMMNMTMIIGNDNDHDEMIMMMLSSKSRDVIVSFVNSFTFAWQCSVFSNSNRVTVGNKVESSLV